MMTSPIHILVVMISLGPLKIIYPSLLQQKVTGHGLMDLTKGRSFGMVTQEVLLKIICIMLGVNINHLIQMQMDSNG